MYASGITVLLIHKCCNGMSNMTQVQVVLTTDFTQHVIDNYPN